MKLEDVHKLDKGLYKVFWREKYGGGMTLAAVGITHRNERWLASVNSVGGTGVSGLEELWRYVDHVVPIEV